MAWSAGTITSATPAAALSQKIKDLITAGPNLGNWSFVKQIPAGTSAGQSGNAAYGIDLYRCRGASTLYERTVQKNLGNSQITTDGTSFAHTITTPPASRFITVMVINTKASAADDPNSVALDGSNAPTFTKIKSQASGAGSGELKMTLWIGKSSASAPTGTILTVSFGATQTGCLVIVDEWQGPDLTLGADGVDATGATKIGVQVVGANGTTETNHGATLAAMLGAKSRAVIWSAEVGSSGTYINGTKAGWTGTAADLAMATPIVHARGEFRVDQNDVTPFLTISTNASQTSWASIAFEFQAKVNTASITDPNDAGQDFYFMMEIPVTDNATVTFAFNCAELYDGNELFARMPPTPTTITPVGPGGWRDDTLISYTNVPGNNRANQLMQQVNTTGFNYWIKMTKNAIIISTKVATVEQSIGCILLDSFVTNAADLPLQMHTSANGVGNVFTRLPGIVASVVTSAFQVQPAPWTAAAYENWTNNAANAQDAWASGKIHSARIASLHRPGQAAAPAPLNNGYLRGLWKADFVCFNLGGTVLLGDTFVLGGNTWTVVGKLFSISAGVPSWALCTRAI